MDRNLFGGSRPTLDEAVHIPIVHNNLKFLKLLSASEETWIPFVKSVPSLLAFESTNLAQSIASLASITAGSPNIRSLQLCLDAPNTEDGRSTSTPSVAWHEKRSENGMRAGGDSISSAERRGSLPKLNLESGLKKRSRKQLQESKRSAISINQKHPARPNYQLANAGYQLHSIRFLTEISVDGAAESVAARLPYFKHLHRIRFSRCQLSDALLSKVAHELKTLRDVDLERCVGVSTIDTLKGSSVARISIKSCPDLTGPINLHGGDFANLEILTLAQLNFVSSIVLYNLPQLRWATLANIESPSVINISDVPRLFDVALDNVLSTQIRVHSKSLCRLYLDLGQSIDSPTSSDGDGGETVAPQASIHLKVANLEKFSWQGERIPISTAVGVISKTPKLQQLELPSTSVEDVQPFATHVRESCPLLKIISCGDGDVPLCNNAPVAGS